MKVVFLPEVEEYLFELTEILYQKEYFGFKESAVRYIKELVLDIRDNLPISSKHIAPLYFARYGAGLYYSSFRKNKNTLWYVFFNVYKTEDDTVYLVRYISNNYEVAQYL
ncbi:hypothetical protein LJC38_01790 [Parabacteroides sp. OttesenSCG-928-K15]|nr:hypothetical protein [Parabacteroides sp. OttesenSCG-928-K15]